MRILFNECNAFERLFLPVIAKKVIDTYPLSEMAEHRLEDMKQAAKLYLESIVTNRISLVGIADSIVIDEPKHDYDFFKEKAFLEKHLNIKIDNNVTIGEWFSYIDLLKNDSRSK